MGILESLFGGGGGSQYDMYGDLFTDTQKAALRDRDMGSGLLRMAGAFAEAAKPTLMPGGGIGSAIGKAAAAMGAGGDEAMNQALKGMQTSELVRASQQKRALNAKISPILLRMIEQQNGLPPDSLAPAAAAMPTAPATPATPASPAAAPDPGGGLPMRFGLGQPTDRSQYGFPARPGAAPPRAHWPAFAPPEWATDAPGSGAGLGPLAPPDELVAQTAPEDGLLARMQRMAAMQQGGGGGSGLPFQLASAAAIPGAGGDEVGSGGGDTSSPEYLARRARDLGLTQKYESGGRNIPQQVIGPQGGYNPSVGRVTGPSSASGLYQMIDSTYRHAAKLAGIDISQWPRAMDAPEPVQTKLAEALYDEQGNSPWDKYNSVLARARGGGAQAGGFSGGGAAPAPGGGAAPGGGTIPGLGMTPQGLAALNALTEMGGLGEPFKSLLETYYKSPSYLGDVKRQSESIETEFAGPKAGAAAAATQKYTQQNAAYEAGLRIKTDMAKDNLTFDKDGNVVPIPGMGELKAEQAGRIAQAQEIWKARLSSPVTAEVLGSDGRRYKTPMTQYEFAQRTEAQGKRVADLAAAGAPPAPPRPGDIVGEPVISKMEEGVASGLVKTHLENYAAATNAIDSIRNTHELRKNLDSGMYTGLGSSWDLFANKFADYWGIAGATAKEKIANTEAYVADLGRETASIIKAAKLGPPTSDNDVKFAERIAGSKDLSEASIRKLLDLREKYGRIVIQKHNREAKGIDQRSFGGLSTVIRDEDVPGTYQREQFRSSTGNPVRIEP